ncbi:MAG: zinc dependent phospholipase C family protein [Ornithinibacter sp.]
MPGHFTHIYTARRVADVLSDPATTSFDAAGSSIDAIADGLKPQDCGRIMKEWERFTALGAVGPDLFFFSQDYSSGPLAAAPFQDDLLMLAMAAYYWGDAAKENDYEPLLLLLAEVNGTFAEIARILIRLQKAWQEFVAVYNKTIKKFVDEVVTVLDDLTGGLVQEFTTAITNLADAILQVIEMEVLTYADIFSWFSLKMRQGWDEQGFVWSDMLHYRRTSQMAANLLVQARAQHKAGASKQQYEQFLAYILGYVCHLGTDTIAHAFVNEQCGGPFRTHYQRHHVIENHMDAHNYRDCGAGGTLTPDAMGATEAFPDIDRSGLVFSVALDPEHPEGWQRPETLSDDPDEAKKQLDVDGEMPDWLADGIVQAMIATYHDAKNPIIEPANLGGGPFQAGLAGSESALLSLLDKADIGIDRPLSELFAQIAPTPAFEVPPGYPLPWEVKVCYRFMISFYKLSFNQGFNLAKPRVPETIIWPPASDFTDLASLPDFSGPSTGDPVEDLCNAIKAIIDWIKKEAERAIKLAGDIVKMLASPFSAPLRAKLHELAMLGWNISTTSHEILAHTGFVYPHGERLYDDGELAVPNEIDIALITLGSTADAAFTQALADASDIMGNLDLDPNVLGQSHDPQRPYPYLPVRQAQTWKEKPNEYRRPWAHPALSRGPDGQLYDTPLELWDVQAEMDRLGLAQDVRTWVRERLGETEGLTIPGPYRQGDLPDALFSGRPGDREKRGQYEAAYSPVITDALNRESAGSQRRASNALGDVVPFSAYLIGRVLSSGGYPVDFNLDADRGFGYLCWDWTRAPGTSAKNVRGQTYVQPKVPPEGSTRDGGAREWNLRSRDLSGAWKQLPVQVQYLDRPRRRRPPSHDQSHDAAPGQGPAEEGLR